MVSIDSVAPAETREPETSATSRWIARAYLQAATATLYILVSALVLDLWWGEWGYENLVTYAQHFGVTGMLGYSSSRPFVFRVLTPAIVHLVTAALNGVGIHSLDPRIHASLQHRFQWWDTGPQLELYVLYLLHFVCLVGTCFVWREFLGQYSTLRKSFVALAPCVGLIAYPLTFVGNGMIYDLVDLFLVSLCVLLWLQRRYAVYYLAYATAVACKEASLVLVALCAARYYLDRDRRRAFVHAALHVGIFALVYLPIRAQLNTTRWEVYLPIQHIAFLLHPSLYASVRLAYAAGLPLPAGLNVLVILLFALSVGLYWRRKPPELRAIFVAMFVALLPMFIVGGFIDEVRVFAMLYPVAFVLGMQTFAWASDSV